MSKPALKHATYEDLQRLPPELRGEIIDGDLYARPRPATAHIRVASNLGGELYNPFHRGRGGPGGWWIFDEPEVHLGRHVLVPDLAGWLKENLKEDPEAKFLSHRPDWVCEVLSPSTASIDRIKKWRVYESSEVPWMWLIDPAGRTLEAFERTGDAYTRLGTWGPKDTPKVRPFDALELELDAIWGDYPADP